MTITVFFLSGIMAQDRPRRKTLKEIIKEEIKDYNDSNDSIELIVHNFFAWYKTATQWTDVKKTEDLYTMPIVVEGDGGYSILNKECFNNLRRYKVSERYIYDLTVASYLCEEKINYVLYDSIDCSVLMECNCDFNSVHYWTNSQDDYTKFEVGRMKKIRSSEYLVLVYIDDSYEYPMRVKVVWEDGEWRIDGLKYFFRIEK